MKALVMTVACLVLFGCSSTTVNHVDPSTGGSAGSAGAAGAPTGGAAGAGGSAGEAGSDGGVEADSPYANNKLVPCKSPQWEVSCNTPFCFQEATIHTVHCGQCATSADCADGGTCNPEWFYCQ